MKVLFIKDVGGVGQRGSIKEVADGYAINFLIPSGAAVQATKEKIAAHEASQKKEGETKAAEQAAVDSTIQSLEGVRIEIKARATEKGGLFKSLGAADIHKSIRDQKKVEIPTAALLLEKPIKELGEHTLELKTPGAHARLIVVVTKAD